MSTMTPNWVKDAVFYQIFPDRFAQSEQLTQNGYPMRPAHLQAWGDVPTTHGFQGGDLYGVIEKLDYLQELGVNALYLNPIFASASNHRYHTHDYFQVDPILGGNEALAALLKAAHARNIRVILDGVFNHASRGFFQFNHLMECGAESPFVDWFHVHHWPVNAYVENQPPNYAAWWGIASLPKFNTKTTAVREFLWRVAEYWLEQGIDGWRLDVPNEIDDDAFWQEFRRRCKAINPDMYIVGELWGEAHRWLKGDQFDAQMNYMFARAAFGFFVGDKMDQSDTSRCGYGHMATLNGAQFALELDKMFNHMYDREIVLAQMNMLGSHDTPRTLTVAGNDVEAVRLMFLCLCTVPGAPNIYYGDEIALPGRHDPDCRRAFPWHDEASWNLSLRQALQSYLQLRRDLPALRHGDFKILFANAHVVVYRRQWGGQTAVVAFNTSTQTEKIIVTADFASELAEKLVADGAGTPFAAGKEIVLLPRNGRVWANEA